jgi:diguanylate cyclase (GGDEF)-like protein
MNTRRIPGIRVRLALLVLAIGAPAALLVAGLLVYDHSRARAVLESDSIETARAMVQAIDRELSSILFAAQVLSTSQRAQAGDLAAFYPQAREVVSLKIGANVVLSDASGRQVMNTLRKPGEALPMHGNPAQLRAVFATGGPVISDLYVGGVLGRPVMSVDVPVFRRGKVAYSLSIGEMPDRFRTILAAQQLPPRWIGAVFDTTGTVVARTQEHERFVGGKGAPELVEAMARKTEGAIDAVTLEGIPVVSVFSRSQATGWTVALGIPRDSLTGPLRQRSEVVALAALAVLALGLGLAWRIGGSIARSVRGLAGPAAQIGLRERIVVPPLGLKEADEVGRALERASELISNAEHRAQHDPLTGLPNRELFLEIAVRQLELCKRNGTRLAVLFIDLDGFKRVNDLHGHEAGDRLLCAVAARLDGAVRGSDVAARLGGDEFAVLLVDASSALAAGVAAKLVDALAAPYDVPPRALEISASIGVAGYPESGLTVEAVLKRADEAMYEAKLAGKRGHAVAAAGNAGVDLDPAQPAARLAGIVRRDG